MVICHYDRRGERWLFLYDCTWGQAYILSCFLRVLRNLHPRNRRRWNGTRTTTEAENERFCANLEQDILTALYKLHPATEEDYRHNELFIL